MVIARGCGEGEMGNFFLKMGERSFKNSESKFSDLPDVLAS